QFIESEEYYKYIAMERDRCLINDKMEERYVEGEVNGIRTERLNKAKLLIQEEYNVENLEWLSACNEKQLDKVFKLIFKELTYDELKIEMLRM
ncbi:MAG: hypothetical protein RR428_09565, partial [Coprobacillus sp.]